MMTCPKCQGFVRHDSDRFGPRLACLNCGWDDTVVDPDALKLSRRPGGYRASREGQRVSKLRVGV
jgi:hypothetical protein